MGKINPTGQKPVEIALNMNPKVQKPYEVINSLVVYGIRFVYFNIRCCYKNLKFYNVKILSGSIKVKLIS